MVQVESNDRWLIESKGNRYKLRNTVPVWLWPGQRIAAKFTVASQSQVVHVNKAYSAEAVPIDFTARILYKVDPDLLTDDHLPKLSELSNGGWQSVLQWQTETLLRRMISDYSWQTLNRESIQQRIERQLMQTLTDLLKPLALNVSSVYLVNMELPANLQHTIVRAERDEIEAQGRAKVLKSYFDIFGSNLPQAMPQIVQWELLNLMHKKGNPSLVLTGSGLGLDQQIPENGMHHPLFQLQLPVAQS